MDFMSVLGGTSTAISLVKAVKDAEVSLDVATIKAKMAEILNELVDVKLGQAALLEENARLQAENARLRAADGDIAKLVDLSGYKYEQQGGSAIGWPACPSCLVKDKAVTFLVQNGKVEEAKCPRCAAQFAPVTSYAVAGLTRREQEMQRRAAGQERLNQMLARRTTY